MSKYQKIPSENFDILEFISASNYGSYHRGMARILGCTVAVYLGELVSMFKYLSAQKKTISLNGIDGFFYFTQEDALEKTGLSRKEQDTCIKVLVNHKFVLKVQHGLPCKRYFRLNVNEIRNFIFQNFQEKSTNLPVLDNLDCPKGANWNDRKGQTEPIRAYTDITNLKDKTKYTPTSHDSSACGDAAALLCAFFSEEWKKVDPTIVLKKPSKQDETDLRKLGNQWSESKIRAAMHWSINHEFWRGRVTSIKSFLKSALTIDVQMRSKASLNAPGSTIEENRSIASDWQNKCNTGQIKGILVDLLNDWVEVSRKGDAYPECIGYGEKDFERMLMRAIKKREAC